jgi:hypothetical protein
MRGYLETAAVARMSQRGRANARRHGEMRVPPLSPRISSSVRAFAAPRFMRATLADPVRAQPEPP